MPAPPGGSLGKRRGGPLATDRPHVADTAKPQHFQGTTDVLPLRPWHAVPKVTFIGTRSGGTYAQLNFRCPCGATHAGRAKTITEPILRRRAACGLRVLLHVEGYAEVAA